MDAQTAREHALRPLLEQLEYAGGDVVPAVAFLAVQAVAIDGEELRAAQRRALLILAAGGDPTRDLDPDTRAVRALAADVDTPGRRKQLAAALEQLAAAATGLPTVGAAAQCLLADSDRAWGWAACALLPDSVTGEE